MFGSYVDPTHCVIEDGKKTLQNAGKRWLTACEISRILAFADTREGSELLCVPTLPMRPPSGSLFVLNYDKKKQKWKEDGYGYERRPNDVGFKEHSERIGDDKKIVCLYSSVCQSDPAYDEYRRHPHAEVKFQRRIYRNVDLEPRLLVVHYFMSKKLKKSEPCSSLEFQKESVGMIGPSLTQHFVENGSMKSENCWPVNREFAAATQGVHSQNYTRNKGSAGCLDEKERAGLCQSTAPILSFWSDKDDESLSGHFGMTVEQSVGEECLNTPSLKSGSNHGVSQISKPSLFMTGEERISELEKQIELLKRQLEQERSNLSGKSTSLANDSASCMVWKDDADQPEPVKPITTTTVYITDFSPDWDYLEGGAKIIMCLKVNPPTRAGAKAVVYFGDYPTDGMMIQDNVLRCYGRQFVTQLLPVCSKGRCLCLSCLRTAQTLIWKAR